MFGECVNVTSEQPFAMSDYGPFIPKQSFQHAFSPFLASLPVVETRQKNYAE
jgi:hypothetical protein